MSTTDEHWTIWSVHQDTPDGAGTGPFLSFEEAVEYAERPTLWASVVVRTERAVVYRVLGRESSDG